MSGFQTRPYGMGLARLTHAHSIAFWASDLSQNWTQFAKKHILRLEPLHLATSANSIACVAAPTRPTFHVFKSQVQFAFKRRPGQVDGVRNVSLSRDASQCNGTLPRHGTPDGL